MKIISNYHSHNSYCDGKNTMEEMVLSSIDKGIKYFGISSHAHIKNEEHWTMSENKLNLYLKEINMLKEKYKEKIYIYKGLEIDYFKDIGLNPTALPIMKELDYFIGSVHSLGSKKSGGYWYVDDTLESMEQGMDELYNGNVQAAVKDYYNNIIDMVIKYQPNIVGHIDIIKKNNKGNYFFNERESWYKEIVKKVLLKIKNKKSIIEINTGGIPRYGYDCLYPSTYILEEINRNNINITVSGDSHDIDSVNFYYDEIYEMIKDIGFERIMILTNNGWEPYLLK